MHGDHTDFENHSHVVAKHLIERGYPKALVENSRRKVKSIPCSSLLEPTSKIASKQNEEKIVFHSNNIKVVKSVKIFSLLVKNNETKEIFLKTAPLIAYKRAKKP